MKYLLSTSTDPHFNMAFDEFCLEQLKADEPVFYLWQNRPSVIIGLNQNPYAEVDLPFMEAAGILLARRVTGGGAVYHDLQNLNYTITGRIRDLDRDCPEYVSTMVRALQALGAPAELSGRNDILVDGRKCSGYAKRMSKDRLMIHGTLMYDVDIDTLTKVLAAPGSKLSAAGIASVRSRVANLKDWMPQFDGIDAFRAALQDLLAGKDGEIRLTDEQLEKIEANAAAKFRTWEWNYGHSPSAVFRVRRKFACGTVEASFTLVHGCLEGLHFGGDFLGNLPADRIERALQGCRFTREALMVALRKEPVENCFDRLSTQELATLLLDA
ncbi:MAG: lipoate--protein ligase [Bacteroidales bacterium]|nr:lipoate--protein ligase [Bacteroidales bacterium]